MATETSPESVVDTPEQAQVDDSTTHGSDKAPAAKRPEVREKHSQPYFEQTLELSSKQAHRVMDRSFKALSGSLFRSEVILRIIGQEDKIDELERTIKTALEKAEGDIVAELERANALCEEQGVNTLANYTHKRDFKIQIKSPLIARYARIVMQMDELIKILDMLWLNDLITSKERAKITFEWQQRIVKAAWAIIRIERAARDEAHNRGHGERVEKEAPKSDHDQDSSLISEGDEILEPVA